MDAPGTLARLEQIVDRSGVAAGIEARLPVGIRPRQLAVRTLLVGMLLAAAADGRPAHLTRVHAALIALPEPEQRRLAIIAPWPHGPHPLTYRQVERTFALIAKALAKDTPDGTPSEALSQVLDALLEASATVLGEPPSSSYAVDWTDHETWSRPPPKRGERAAADAHEPSPTDTEQTAPQPDAQRAGEARKPTPSDAEHTDTRRADPEASWGHRRGDAPGQTDETFFGYYLQVVTSVNDERGPEVPELVRRIQLASCAHDPPAKLVPVIERMAANDIKIGDILADTGYSYRVAENWALPLRRLGAQLVHDLHPNDRGPNGTHMSAIRLNGNLYCPATPAPLLELGPLARGATEQQTTAHDQQTAELHRYKLAPLTGYDQDGFRRVACPATQGRLRCPLKPESLQLPHDRPTILAAPEDSPPCCRQQTLTVPPSVNAKTAQKHDYPSRTHRSSYARRSSAERAYASIKDPATTDLSRGWCRLMGLVPNALFAAAAIATRNLRVADAFAARQADNQRRATRGLPPKRRKRRRQTTKDLIGTANTPP